MARNDVARTGAAMDVADLPGGGREKRVARVPLGCHQFGQRRRHLVDRVARKLRVGDVPLHAFDNQFARHGPTSTIFDRVA